MTRPLALALLVAVLGGSLPGCIVFVEGRDYPRILEADAYCARDGWWEFTADVAHPDGDHLVDFVWAEVTEVWWDGWTGDRVYTYLGDVELAYDGDGLWYTEVASSPRFLDCFWAYDYDLQFIAEDADGDRDSYTITR